MFNMLIVMTVNPHSISARAAYERKKVLPEGQECMCFALPSVHYTEKPPKRLEGKRLPTVWLAAMATMRRFLSLAVSGLESLDEPEESRISEGLTGGVSQCSTQLDLPYEHGYNAPMPMRE
jgi:hypothetical protein